MAISSTSYPRKWQSGKTTVIRVPERFADDLLKIARKLDEQGGCRIREDRDTFVLELPLPEKVRYTAQKPINVASVPQRSPFRYPGGKTWLVPYLRDWLAAKRPRPARLVEPFAGGAIVSLTAGFENLARHIIFSELDPGVAAVWKVVLNGHSEWLAKKILAFQLTEDEARRTLSLTTSNLRDLAFQTLLRNRVQRGGIMAPGAGLVKTGENGRGITSRWYPETLARRIREINHAKDKFTFVETDAFKIIHEFQDDAETCFYLDPPYTVAARRLYVAWQVNHQRLFSEMQKCKGDLLMSYDNTAEVVALAGKFGFQTRAIAMKNTHHARVTELLIGRDLSWLKE
ncbi:MAG: DNA adenine methylase [Verrucomicrobiales bacterium]|jgi:DNA adenine methylase|nr:DNA adenine methylase [Verrucomicrobiales bacterium]